MRSVVVALVLAGTSVARPAAAEEWPLPSPAQRAPLPERLHLEGLEVRPSPAPETRLAPGPPGLTMPPGREVVPPALTGRCGTIQALGPGLAAYFHEVWRAYTAVATAVLPHLGARAAGGGIGAPRLVLAWPLTVPFLAPTRSRVIRYDCAGEIVDAFRSHRAVLESGVVLSSPAVPYVRAGYRLAWHPGRGVVGLGAGLGSTVELDGGPAPRASASPELLLLFGRCCYPGYGLLALRYDRFWSGAARETFLASVGLAY
jgi:hypothetical protein